VEGPPYIVNLVKSVGNCVYISCFTPSCVLLLGPGGVLPAHLSKKVNKSKGPSTLFPLTQPLMTRHLLQLKDEGTKGTGSHPQSGKNMWYKSI